MFYSYRRHLPKDKSALGSQKGNNSYCLDGIKKRKISESHKKAKLAHDASNAQPGMAPLELLSV